MGIKERTNIVRTIRTLIASLESHLDHAIESKGNCSSCGNRKFHAETIKEYAGSIKDLADTL